MKTSIDFLDRIKSSEVSNRATYGDQMFLNKAISRISKRDRTERIILPLVVFLYPALPLWVTLVQYADELLWIRIFLFIAFVPNWIMCAKLWHKYLRHDRVRYQAAIDAYMKELHVVEVVDFWKIPVNR